MVYLLGELGAGKTSLVRGLLRALGVDGPVPSPTYTLVEPYRVAGRSLLHADLYRLQDPAELYQLGIEEQPPTQAWWWVEWPERGAGVLPPADAVIELSVAGGGRRAAIECAPGSESLCRMLIAAGIG
jgi:tRNA threonylcarbamoyladenosine biosynthesis protein TsaE